MNDMNHGMAMAPIPEPVAIRPIAVPGLSGYNFPPIARRHGKTPEWANPQRLKKRIAHFPGTEEAIKSATKRREKRPTR